VNDTPAMHYEIGYGFRPCDYWSEGDPTGEEVMEALAGAGEYLRTRAEEEGPRSAP
jgi:hypothetical protein